ncbi:MAG: fumarylacetoacetate hydrolase [Acidimicrobiales bacterium]|nr:MAG: fumarylacetoacetate hydrolase [Acidimicrobiales bacterium]
MFRLTNVEGRACLVVGSEDGSFTVDLASWSGDEALGDPMAAIGRHAELHDLQERLSREGVSPNHPNVVSGRRGPCVPRPSKVFAIGLNYRSHAAELGSPIPDEPLVFTKFPSCLAGPNDEVHLSGSRVDWEVELVVVIGRRVRHVSPEDAWEAVAGLTLGQDVSDRDLQFRGSPPQFSLGKSFDTFGPIGPEIVSPDAFDDPDDIEISCEISGETMQRARTSDMIFSVPELISYLSHVCTLEAGDLVFTGTPSGVGMGRGRYLRDGDVIVSRAESIGTMRNRCVTGQGASRDG